MSEPAPPTGTLGSGHSPQHRAAFPLTERAFETSSLSLLDKPIHGSRGWNCEP